jgi:tetratricopeptide (TPR) repeat protein
MLEPIRQYALEKLRRAARSNGCAPGTPRISATWPCEPDLELKRAEQASWLERLAVEHDNLRAALSCALEGGEAERVSRIGWAIHRFWSLRGHTGEGRQWMERALARTDELSDDARARALYVVSMLSYVRGEIDRTVQTVEESIAVSRAAGDSEALAAAVLGRGLTSLSEGNLDAAGKRLRESLEMLREQDDRSGAALALVGLAQVALAYDDFERATETLSEAEVMSRSVGDWFTLTAVLSSRALTTRLRGDEARTSALLRESVQLAGTLGDAWHVVFGITGLAGGAARRGRPEQAARLFGAAGVLCETMGVDVPSPAWRALNERDLTLARELLDVEAFDAAWAEGRAMTMQRVVVEAVADDT